MFAASPFTAILFAAALLAVALPAAAGTQVRFDTTIGQIDVDLTDSLTPKTVQNFLSYVNDHAWDNSFIHRSVPGFVIQGGGYLAESEVPHVDTIPPVVNEFKKGTTLSNVRGAIAMAKLDGNPNSATSEWFFNLVDNNNPLDPNSLDNKNGGFTAFGTVINNTMTVVDAIAALRRVNVGRPFDNLPVRNLADGAAVGFEHLIKLNYVTVIPAPFQNQTIRFDVDGNSRIEPLDVLSIIDTINASPSGPKLLGIEFTGALHYDITGDARVTPLDVLAVIDEINRPKTLSVGAAWGPGSGVVSVPEPASLGLGALGALAVVALGLRRGR